jgi:plastocyanin
MRMRIFMWVVTGMAVLLCGSASAQNKVSKNYNVSIRGAFIPSSVTINVGDSVTWRNTDDVNHTVTAIDGTFKSGTLKPGDTFTWVFRAAGQEPYECMLVNRLRGVVIVNPN